MQESFVNGPLAGHLKREAGAVFGSAQSLGLLALVALLAGFAGPFGTYEAFSPLARHLYWALVVLGTAAAGHLTGTAVEYYLSRLAWPTLPRLLVASGMTAQPVFGVVALALFGFGLKPDGRELLLLYVQCAAVVGSVSVFLALADQSARKPKTDATPKLVDRLPGAKRGRLIRLAAQDHYVEVVTEGGRTLLPMRFRDAIAETAPETGAQVHRSHWVALRAISGRCRINDKSGLRLSDGSFVPVGRKFRPAARRQGIL